MESEVENKDKKAAQLQYLFSKYKTLASQNVRCTRFSWLQRVANISLIIKFSCPNFPSGLDCEVTGDDQTLFILESMKSDYQVDIADCDTFEDVLDLLAELMRRSESKMAGRLLSVSAVEATGRVLEEIRRLGLERVSSVSADLRTVTLCCGESDSDRSRLEVNFPLDYPSSGLTLQHGLPSCWVPPTSSLTSLYSSWTAALQDLTPAWRELEELDRLCLVLDPASSKQLHRRIAVNSSVSLYVELEPSNPTAVPTVKFLGSTDNTELLRRCWANNIDLWDDEDPVLTNLERVLAVEFPGPDSRDVQSQSSSVECGICMEEESAEDEDEVASVMCDDDKCKARFHPSCLYQWLLRAPNRRAFSGMLTGRCPNCQKPIVLSKPSKF